MKWIGIALIYIAFFALIGTACYCSDSAWPLLALVFTPKYKQIDDGNNI